MCGSILTRADSFITHLLDAIEGGRAAPERIDLLL